MFVFEKIARLWESPGVETFTETEVLLSFRTGSGPPASSSTNVITPYKMNAHNYTKLRKKPHHQQENSSVKFTPKEGIAES